jgi:hypothetical protein
LDQAVSAIGPRIAWIAEQCLLRFTDIKETAAIRAFSPSARHVDIASTCSGSYTLNRDIPGHAIRQRHCPNFTRTGFK